MELARARKSDAKTPESRWKVTRAAGRLRPLFVFAWSHEVPGFRKTGHCKGRDGTPVNPPITIAPMNSHDPRRTVLLLVDRRSSTLKARLLKAGYRVVEAYTTDRAVAICVNNLIDAAVLDQCLFVETDGWSVAQSLKAVKSNLCVLLSMSATKLGRKLPRGVDAIVPQEDHEQTLAGLKRLLS